LEAKRAISSTTNHEKDQQAEALGFDEVIDVSRERLVDGVRRITGSYGADIVIDFIACEVISEAPTTLAPTGSLTTLGYLAGRNTTIDVSELIRKRTSIKSFSLFVQQPGLWTEAWKAIVSPLNSERSKQS